MSKNITSFACYRPLCSLDSENILVSKRNRLFSFHLKTNQMTFLAEAPASWKQNILGRSSLCSRLLRLGIHTATRLQDQIYFAYNRSLYFYDMGQRTVQLDHVLARGSRPLNLTVIQNIKGFDDGICYGEYFSNPSNSTVHIFKKDKSGWKTAFTFPDKTIEHVHNIVPDPEQNCVWILTGDFGDSAAIWKATDNFRQVEAVLKGSQQHRACVAFPTSQGLLYATDSQMEQNYLRLLSNKNGTYHSQEILPINGPSIYGCRLKDFYVFSTSSEPGMTDESLFFQLLDWKKGPGIIEDQAEILVIDSNFKLQAKFQNPKDFLPYNTFQFGSITFPSGMEFSNTLPSFNIALKQNDFSMEVREICTQR